MNGNQTKTIAKNTLYLYFRMLFLMFISLYTGRVILDALGIDDYGIYNVVGGFVAMFALVSSSLTSANTRFLNYEMGKGNIEKLNKVFSSCVTIQYALALLVAILCETIGLWYVNNIMVLPPERLHAANLCFQISIFNFCMSLVTVPYNAAIIAHERMKAFAYVSIFEGLAKLVICFIIMWNPFDRLVYYALLLLIVQFTVRFLYQRYCRKNFTECKYHFVIDKELLKHIFSYAGWHVVGNSASILKNQGVNMVLNLFFGPAVNAAKGVSNQVLATVTGFSKNFIMAVNPQITQSYAKKEYEYMFKLVFKGARFSFYMLFFLSLPIIINGDYLLNLWLKKVPEYSVIFCKLSFAVVLIDSLSNTLITAQNATGNVRNYQLIVGGVMLLNLPISYLCLWVGMPPYAVMFVAIIVETLVLLARLFMIPKYIKQFNAWEFFKRVILNCLTVASISTAVPLIIYHILPANLLTFVLNISICLFVSATMILFVGCEHSERTVILDKVSMLRSKFIKK